MNRCAWVKPDARSIKPRGPDAVLGSRFVEILRLRGMVRLLLPALVARIPDSIAATGIVVLVRSVTGSYTVAGPAAGAFGIGTAASAPLAGRALDRLGQRRVLPVLAAAFGAALTVLVVAAGHLGASGLACLAAAAGMTPVPARLCMAQASRGSCGLRARLHLPRTHLDRRPATARFSPRGWQAAASPARLRHTQPRRYRRLRHKPAPP